MRARGLLGAVPLALAAGLALVFSDVRGVDARQQEAAFEDGVLEFRHLDVEQGLPSPLVLSVVQDALGFIWIGTGEGLVRYDGIEMETFKRDSDSTSISGNVVQALAPDVDGSVWVGTGSGLSRYDPAGDRFSRIDGLSSNEILALAPDSTGRTWVGTSDGVARVSQDGRIETVDTDRLPNPSAVSLLVDGDDLWVGTEDGLARRDRDGRIQSFMPDSISFPSGFYVTAIRPRAAGGLWLGTFGGGLLSFDPDSSRFRAIDTGGALITQNVTDVYEDASGTVWVATLGGLQRVAPDGSVQTYEAVPDDPTSLSGNEVSALYEDRQGILWVATYDGVDRFDRARGAAARLRHDPEDPTTLADSHVRAVLATRSGVLWVGTERSLDWSLDGRTFQRASPPAGAEPIRAIRALHESEDGTVWAGTPAGLFRLDGDRRAEPVSLDGEVAVAALHSDETEALWIGTLAGGLGRYDPAGGDLRFFGASPGGLPDDHVVSLEQDAAGALWVGTASGLCRLDGQAGEGSFTCLPVDESDPSALADGYIHGLHAQPNGDLWIGTRRGLHRLDTRDVPAGIMQRYRSASSDLPADEVYSILEDGDGLLWVSTSVGVTRLDPLTGVFSTRAGLGGGERTLTAAGTRGPDGRLYIGSQRGLLAFSPEQSAAVNTTPPQVAITAVEVAGQPVTPENGRTDVPVSVAEQLDLDHDHGYLTVQYAGLHFSAPTQNTYRYRLVGLSDDWREVGTQREAQYTALPPGRYTFEVQAANADGIGFGEMPRAAQASLALVVSPPWWRRWWSILGFIALGVFALVRADRWQRKRLLREERDRAERREAELRADAAEAEQREAQAEAAKLKAENDRKAAELERTRDVEAANAKLAEANRQLETSLHDLQQTQNQLVQSEKLASLGQLTAGIAHEIKNPLNFVNNFADLSVELADELHEEMSDAGERPTSAVLDDVKDLIENLQENARRIREHGQRADRIVRSMLMHSRGGSSERGRVDINRFIDEYANLAFHGARANDSDFQVELVRDFAEDAGEIEIVPQEFGRVLINLLANAFHAVTEQASVAESGYTPEVTLRTVRDGHQVTIEVADNGTGIPDDVRDRIFVPFFTTKPTGKGTGLGLSLAYDIVTQIHSGQMSVESTEGEGTTFRVALPDGGLGSET
ncbi:MAG: two-component regulator propeller domain-containing protein [Bacteroidota bacterium]